MFSPLVVPPTLSTFWRLGDSEAIVSSVPVAPSVLFVPPAFIAVTAVSAVTAVTAVAVVAAAVPFSITIAAFPRGRRDAALRGGHGAEGAGAGEARQGERGGDGLGPLCAAGRLGGHRAQAAGAGPAGRAAGLGAELGRVAGRCHKVTLVLSLGMTQSLTNCVCKKIKINEAVVYSTGVKHKARWTDAAAAVVVCHYCSLTPG